jgi:hypothetical protein
MFTIPEPATSQQIAATLLREMLIFTAYHQVHHLEGVKRRRGELHAG